MSNFVSTKMFHECVSCISYIVSLIQRAVTFIVAVRSFGEGRAGNGTVFTALGEKGPEDNR